MPKAEVEVEPGEQLQLLDTDHPARAQIMRICGAINKADKERSAAQTKATDQRDKLAEVMHEHKLTDFRAGKYVVRLTGIERVSVKKITATENDSDDEEDDGPVGE